MIIQQTVLGKFCKNMPSRIQGLRCYMQPWLYEICFLYINQFIRAENLHKIYIFGNYADKNTRLHRIDASFVYSVLSVNKHSCVLKFKSCRFKGVIGCLIFWKRKTSTLSY